MTTSSIIESSTRIQIHVHIRRGLISQNQLPERYVPTEWYRQNLQALIKHLQNEDIGADIFVHTDAPQTTLDWKLPSELSVSSQDYFTRNGIVTENETIKLYGEDFFSTLNLGAPIQIISDIDPLTAWQLMSGADILLIGKSSFSFVGSLLSAKAIVISPTHLNTKENSIPSLSDWLRGENYELIASVCIQRLKHKHPQLFK